MTVRVRPAVRLLESRDTPAGLFATSTAAGAVVAYDTDTWAETFQVTPFPEVSAPARTAVADLTGDGTPDVVAAPAAGGGPVLVINDGATGQEVRRFAVGDEADRSGVSVAAAGVDSDGAPLLAVGTVVNGVATVRTVRGDGTVVESFVPFAGFTGGLSVAAADLTGDGTTDIVVGAGAAGAPRLAAFSGTDRSTLFNDYAFEPSFTGGVEVSVGDLSGDGRAEVVAAAGKLGGPRVQVYDPTTWQVRNNFFAFDSESREGVRAAVFASSAGGANAVLTTDGATGQSMAFDAVNMAATAAPTLAGLPGGGAVATTAPRLSVPESPDGLSATIPDLQSDGWQETSSGVWIEDAVAGDGAEVTAESSVTVYYAGYLTDGTEFDSTRHPSEPVTFALSGLITGWQEGLKGMKAGGVRRMYIPSSLGYGEAGAGDSIPANADLVFEVKLVAVS